MKDNKKYRRAVISSKIGKAIGDYNLIEEGDRILVAVSGGKDSLTLLKFLKERQNWSPVKYGLFAAHIETDFQTGVSSQRTALTRLFEQMEVEYRFKKIKIINKEKRTDCFWCAWNRRKALFEIADELGCGKVAFGHHKDDIVETTMLNLFFNGEFSSMNPRQELFGGKIVVIRPLCYVEEKTIKEFAKENSFPSGFCKCPYSQDSQRSYVKALIRDIEKHSPGLKTNIFKSIERIKYDYLALKDEHGTESARVSV